MTSHETKLLETALVIQNPDGTEQRLTPDQRSVLLRELGEKEKIAFNSIRQKLGFLETQKFNAEYKTGPSGKRNESLRGDVFAAAMRNKNVFGPKAWDAMDERRKVSLNEMFVELEDDDLAGRLAAEFALSSTQVQAAMKASLPQGYMSFSRKAILRLLPFLESGALTNEAIVRAGYRAQDMPRAEAVASLPLPPDLRNPIVQKALFELRKVVNAIVGEYGKPARIKIEMARDVQGSIRQREELHWKMLENRKTNDRVRERLAEDIGIASPTRNDIIKFKLWEECRKTCPYTAKPISQDALFGANPEFQVEHILPYDRSLDDSYMNLTLCEVHENIHVKRNQSPFEAYHGDPAKYEQIAQNIKVLPWPKQQKFLQQEISLDSQISRELNDTRYICRVAVAYLGQLGIHVRGTRGKVTAELRHQWGLDGVFSELGVRRDDDHRRHAVDALIVAVTNDKELRRLAASKYAIAGVRFDLPWVTFRDEARHKVQDIMVSHRVCRKVSGALHEETSYGPTGLKDENGQAIYAYRKRLEELTIPMVDAIVDNVVRDILRRRLVEKGVDLHVTSKKIPGEVWKEPLYMRCTSSDKRVPIKKVRIREVMNHAIALCDETGRAYRAVKPGSNHHIEVFEYVDEKGRTRRDGRVITTFEAVQRSRRGEPVVRRDYQDGRRFVSSAAINETFMLQLEEGAEQLFRVQKISSNQQIFFRHHTFGGELHGSKGISKYPNTLIGRKVSVDPLGRVRPARD